MAVRLPIETGARSLGKKGYVVTIIIELFSLAEAAAPLAYKFLPKENFQPIEVGSKLHPLVQNPIKFGAPFRTKIVHVPNDD